MSYEKSKVVRRVRSSVGETPRWRGAMSVACPKCSASIGHHCRTQSTRRTSRSAPHPERRQAAKDVRR